MKIDFDGNYREVSRLLRNSQAPAQRSNEFADTLGSISPDKPKSLNLGVKRAVEAAPDPASTDMSMGSLRQVLPEQIPADFAPLSLQFEPLPSEITDTTTVNSPTLLEVKRIDIPVGSPPRADDRTSREEKMEVVRNLLNTAADKHGVDPALGMAVVKNESNFNPRAVSQDGHSSKGLFQLLDSTGQDLMGRMDMKGTYDPFNPSMNVDLGVSYLRYLHDIFSSPTKLPNDRATQAAANSTSLEKLAVAAFNAGEGRVASAQARAERAGKDPTTYEHVSQYLPQSTQQYVERVMSSKKLF